MILLPDGSKASSACQQMGETRDPMARDCVQDALRLANLYEHVGEDFWICFASKPHTQKKNALVHGWEVVFKRPAIPVPGMLVWHVDQKKKQMNLDTKLSMPYDIPLEEELLSTKGEDVVATLGETAKASGSVLLA